MEKIQKIDKTYRQLEAQNPDSPQDEFGYNNMAMHQLAEKALGRDGSERLKALSKEFTPLVQGQGMSGGFIRPPQFFLREWMNAYRAVSQEASTKPLENQPQEQETRQETPTATKAEDLPSPVPEEVVTAATEPKVNIPLERPVSSTDNNQAPEQPINTEPIAQPAEPQKSEAQKPENVPVAPLKPPTEVQKPPETLTDPKEVLDYSSKRVADQLTNLIGVMKNIDGRGTPMNREAVSKLSAVQESLLQFATNPDRDSSQFSDVLNQLDRVMSQSLDQAGELPNRETPQALRYLANNINEYDNELRKTVSWAIENETDPNKKAELKQSYNKFRVRLDGQVNYLYEKAEDARRITGG